MSFNHIKKMENLNFRALNTLTLSNNKIKKIENIRGLRKLERLALDGNEITRVALDTTEPFLELKELELARNQIRSIEAVTHFPNLEELGLTGNPLQLIFPEAFSQMKQL